MRTSRRALIVALCILAGWNALDAQGRMRAKKMSVGSSGGGGGGSFNFAATYSGADASTHGSTFTVNGPGGFGTRSPQATFAYDDFQSVTTNSNINTSTAVTWAANGGDVGGTFPPIASTARLRSGTPFTKNMRSHWQPSDDRSNIALLSQTFTTVYLDFWYYIDSSSGSGFATDNMNMKIFRLHQNNAGAPNLYFSTASDPSDTNNDAKCGAQDGTASSDVGSCQPGGNPAENGNLTGKEIFGVNFWNQWIHYQWMIKASNGAAADGTRIMWKNGQLWYNRPANLETLNTGFTSWTEIYVGNYVRQADYSGDIYAFVESLYLDKQWSRVEISDCTTTYSSTSQACHREIQKITAWSDTSFTVTLNRGSFSSFSGLAMWATPVSCTTHNCPVKIGTWP